MQFENCPNNDQPTYRQYKEMLWVIKAVLDSKGKGLRINPISIVHALWTLQAFSDMDSGAD